MAGEGAPVTDAGLLRRLNACATAFAIAACATAPDGSFGTGVAIVVFAVGDPFVVTLEFDGVVVATRPGDPELGPLVGEIVQRGLASVDPAKRALAGEMLQQGRASIALAVPLGQDAPSVHGLIVATHDPSVQQELFALVAAKSRPSTVH
jgi:hypothetical protein